MAHKNEGFGASITHKFSHRARLRGVAGWASLRHAAVLEAFVVAVKADYDFAIPCVKNHGLRQSCQYAIFGFSPCGEVEFDFCHIRGYVGRRRRKDVLWRIPSN